MDCICNKGAKDESFDDNGNEKDGDFNKGSVQLIAPTPTKNDDLLVDRRYSLRQPSKTGRFSVDIAGYPARPLTELVAARWPSCFLGSSGWKTLICNGILTLIGQGAYSSVYKARDLETGKIVAMLAATPGIKLTEQQLFRGLEHCHSHGVLHRDIKGSNLLIDKNGVLKIADFGLATLFKLDQKQPLTSCVVTLWYRAPKLLLGANRYGVAIDMWSAGCILAELFSGKPILPGRTEVEQMHRIFKLCGSPSEENFPHSALSLVDKLLSLEPDFRGSATSALRSEFFTIEPFPCNPIGSYPPTKEQDAKLRNEEARRKRAEAVKGRGAELVHSPEFIAQGPSKPVTTLKYDHPSASAIGVDPCKVTSQNGLTRSSSMIHPSAPTLPIRKMIEHQTMIKPRSDDLVIVHCMPMFRGHESVRYGYGYVAKKNRTHCSGSLVPPGGNNQDMLKEDERQIQQAVRKGRIEK
ncbi:putative serine/threonine-protein kinase [Hibiscus syriacus]|uniref:Serine/threonine-protein kinase n=1 Tax=Hibiscus syriacus TaxID=106335 RepID=A0A6A3ABK3_HIBSY|nr:putative serine/threonine-protein kinase [Hibiscus syriacus]